MVVNDLGKLVLLGLALIGGMAMILTRVDGAAGQAICVYVLGYLTGNGVLARRGQAPSPVIVTSPERLDNMAD